MEAPLWSCHLLVFLLFGCLEAMDPLLDPDDPDLARPRERVMTFSAHDPCSRGGYWFAIDDETKVRAQADCTQAYNDFLLLTDQERASCPNAQRPDCRSGFGCNRMEYKCTFLCETEVEDRRRQNWRVRQSGRTTSIVLKPKYLRTIAATVVEPRFIVEGYEPLVYFRGAVRGQRRRTRAYRPH